MTRKRSTVPTMLSSFNTASGMRSHVTSRYLFERIEKAGSFNTASGMRSHVTRKENDDHEALEWFQYRKRYEVTCDLLLSVYKICYWYRFNTASGMRSHVTSTKFSARSRVKTSFNTASGMRSHVTKKDIMDMVNFPVSIPQAV